MRFDTGPCRTRSHRVIQAASGLSASRNNHLFVDRLRLVETDASIQLMCTDIVMPGDLNGFDLARRAEQVRPDMKLLYMSAYSVAEQVRAAQGDPPPLVRKPFRLDYLLETIESALH